MSGQPAFGGHDRGFPTRGPACPPRTWPAPAVPAAEPGGLVGARSPPSGVQFGAVAHPRLRGGVSWKRRPTSGHKGEQRFCSGSGRLGREIFDLKVILHRDAAPLWTRGRGRSAVGLRLPRHSCRSRSHGRGRPALWIASCPAPGLYSGRSWPVWLRDWTGGWTSEICISRTVAILRGCLLAPMTPPCALEPLSFRSGGAVHRLLEHEEKVPGILSPLRPRCDASGLAGFFPMGPALEAPNAGDRRHPRRPPTGPDGRTREAMRDPDLCWCLTLCRFEIAARHAGGLSPHEHNRSIQGITGASAVCSPPSSGWVWEA